MQVTKRWKIVITVGTVDFDMIEIDHQEYICIPSYQPSTDYLVELRKGKVTQPYTLEKLESLKGSHPNFTVMYHLALQEHIDCECGSGAPAGPGHSDYCPRYRKD